MPRLRGKVDRQQLPSGRDGQVLVLDTRSPNGIAWRSGIDRLVTDITPELSGDLDCNSFALTELGNVTFAAGTNTIAGIRSDRLVDKQSASFTANVAMGTHKITGLGAPTAGTDAATKTYVDGSSYFSGNLSITPATVTFPATLAWTDVSGAYGDQVASGFSAHASSGEITYSGGYTGRFLVQFGGTFVTLSYNRYHLVYMKAQRDGGGGFADVAGSIIHDNHYGNFSAGGYIYRYPRMFGATVVELDTGDKLKLQYGLDVIGASMALSSFGTDSTTDGVSLIITNLDRD